MSFLFSFQMFGFGQLGNILKVTMFCRCVGSSFLYISHASYLCEWKVQKICCLLLQRNKWKFAYPKWWLCDCLPLTHFSIRTQILKTTKTPLFFTKNWNEFYREKICQISWIKTGESSCDDYPQLKCSMCARIQSIVESNVVEMNVISKLPPKLHSKFRLWSVWLQSFIQTCTETSHGVKTSQNKL